MHRLSSGILQPSSNATTCYQRERTIVLRGGVANVEVPLSSYILCADRVYICTLQGSVWRKVNATCKNASQVSQATAPSLAHPARESCAPKWLSLKNVHVVSSSHKTPNPARAANGAPPGTNKNATGEVVLKPWLAVPWDCTLEQYLNNTDNNRLAWQCVTCPVGGSCIPKNTTWVSLGPMFGFWKIPAVDRTDGWHNVFAEATTRHASEVPIQHSQVYTSTVPAKTLPISDN